MPYYNVKNAPRFATADEALEWADSLGLSKYDQVTCYIGDRYTCIQSTGMCEDDYRGAIETAITSFLESCGLSGYEDTEGVGVDVAAEATSMLYDYLERNGIMDMLWLHDSY